MTRVWDHSSQKGSELLLLLAIADYADDNGFAWPGLETLANKTRLSIRHTTRLVGQLAETKELIVFTRRARGNVYIVTTGITESALKSALTRADSFGIESDNLALIHDNLADFILTTCHDNVTPASCKSDIAMSPDPSLTTNDPSNNSPGDNGQDDEWLKHSRIVEPDEPKPAHTGAIPTDPLTHAVQASRAQQQNWADPPDAGGADDYADDPVNAFCQLVGISSTKLPQKKRKDWGKALRGVAHEWGVGPPVLSRCIQGMPESEFSWKTYSSPWQDGFKADLGVLIGQVLAGKGPGSPKIIEVKGR